MLDSTLNELMTSTQTLAYVQSAATDTVSFATYLGHGTHITLMWPMRCNIVNRSTDVLTALIYSMFAPIRTYAVWNKDRRVFGCVLIPGLGYPLGYIVYSTQTVYSAAMPPLIGCQYKNKLPDHLASSSKPAEESLYSLTPDIIGLCLVILFECITLSLTWIKTFPAVRRQFRQRRDATEVPYLSVILVTQAIGLLGFSLNSVDVAGVITETLASVLISRFILDLRMEHPATCHDAQGSSLLFACEISSAAFAARREHGSTITTTTGNAIHPELPAYVVGSA
ncbi:hypothetical protein BC629DRAFT_1442889 [Irpex lacteus]|nr:hypothetical protein BC629DRAFT_1442889 [Irpex lacteus]